ncbi:MAG: hypothetical protein JSR82_13665 [Verrucomicrobia bacterium]|nr:hypothetical protein [Verrucomicrobiota bacterium]
MKRTDIFERADDWNTRGDGLRLRPGEWMLLESIDGWHTIGEILDEGEWDQPSTEASIEKLLQLGLIRRNEYSWEEYCHRFREDDDEGVEIFEPMPAEEAPAAVVAELSAPVFVEAPPPPPAPPVPELPAATPVATAVPSASPAPVPATPPPASPLPLREVLDFVMDRAGGGPKGQLAVYRTFLKIPMHQLRESGIKSLNVTTSDLMITDPALQQSLLKAVASVVGEPFDREPSLAGS